MLQQILSVGRAVLHLTDDTHQFGMQSVDAQVDHRTLTGLNDLVVELLLNLSYDLLDACGMDTSVGDEPDEVPDGRPHGG